MINSTAFETGGASRLSTSKELPRELPSYIFFFMLHLKNDSEMASRFNCPAPTGISMNISVATVSVEHRKTGPMSVFH